MKVYLAGYNVDTTVLRELQKEGRERMDVTPEVLSAAYARISRDPRPVNELRDDSRNEVERARKSNQTIIFKMGHHSVAEHAVFNLDILGVSRLAMEELEKFRLCSYTEKSQRYITLDKDFVIPGEIKGTRYEAIFTEMIRQQNEAYHQFFAKLKTYVFEKHVQLAKDEKNHNLLEGWAKEDARYITALATESQVGLTVNARNLELMLRRFASHPLSEIQELGRAVYGAISEVAPSIVLFHSANDRDLRTYPELKELAGDMIRKAPGDVSGKDRADVQLIEYNEDSDTLVAAALLHTSSDLDYQQCKVMAKAMSESDRKRIFETVFRNLQLYDSMLREFEYVNLTYQIVLSAACFGQLKRHRMATTTAQAYDPRLGITVPESVRETGLEEPFRAMVEKTNEAYQTLRREVPLAAPYILTNAHRKRVLMRVNARELYHISRLREDAHAQWDIQNIARAMSGEARKVMPLVCGLIGGKDRYNEIYASLYGHPPKVTEAVLPGVRKIK
ncbi:MAG: FAD-dependent thymidylate synthase [Candidatus Omnitrophica bacterium]|nr:FAD-dependent thymidylate synthase [Candidatus Omnitrophota bacterium]